MTRTQPTALPYFRTPVISPSGEQIAFVYAADIWLVPVAGGRAERLTAHPSSHHAPRWSPDGTQLAFTSTRTGAGDLYVLSFTNGDVRRVTYHEQASTAEAWSADGQYLFFSSLRDLQGTAIYRVAANGGTPVPWLAQPYERLIHLSVSPDGSQLAFNVSRDPWWRRGPNPYGGAEVWTVSNAVDATDYRKISDYTGLNRWPLWAADGPALFFVSDRDGAENIWQQPLDGGPARRITHFMEGRVLWPTISGDGRTIVFERNFRIWKLDLMSGTIEQIHVQTHPDTKMTPVRVQRYARDFSEFVLSPDGKKIAFVARGEIFVDFADKETDRERRQGPAFRVTNTDARESDVRWSPDSRKLVYVSDRHGDGEVYLYDVAARVEQRLTNDERPTSGPRFSPDGKWIAFVRGDEEIRLLQVATGEDRPFIKARFTSGTGLAWSPDSQWLVYVAQDERLFSNLYVQRVGEEQNRQITFLSNLRAWNPQWAPSGEFILFTTSQYRAESQIVRVDLRPQAPTFREEEFEKLFEEKKKDEGQTTNEGNDASATPADNPVKSRTPELLEIMFDGIARRMRFLTPTQMNARVQCISSDSRDLIFSATVAGKLNLWTMPLDEPRRDQAPRQLTTNPGFKDAAQFAPDGKSFYVLDGGQIVQRKFLKGEQNNVPLMGEVTVNFNKEKIQIFEESWRLLRDHFYDPTFRGLDWSAAREQFAPLVAGAQTPGDLYTLLNLMVGELRASHLGVGGGGSMLQDGYIGLLFDSKEQASSGRFRVAGILPDSPAALAGEQIVIGDYLLAVNNVPLDSGTNLDELLQRMAGRRVVLRLSQQPDGSGSIREVAVRPVDAYQYEHLCYQAWTLANEEYVHRVSGGRLGYVHINAMSYEAYQHFLADLDAETYSKEGVVIDVRFNGGGHIATFILDVLSRRSVLRSGYRDQPSVDAGYFHGNRVLSKPTVLVINERSLSNTEGFVEGYRRLGLGTVVGRPTGGAVISTIDWRLLDGATFRLPRYKVATLEGEDLEGQGRPPDIDVALPLGASARGEDPQLDAAIRMLLQQIDQQA
ncbi:MAG TPA: S41 family peptidase [Roseiflexaceae bacterium]|nr:S41 family peptidase [Roseiflexaceae bacterium]